jgi:serine/threonine-protein kinase
MTLQSLAEHKPVVAPLEIGQVVAERYEILEELGRGTSGTVYRAADLHVNTEHETVAIKAIHGHLHADRQIYGRFRREVEILRRLEGPHVCKLLDCVEDDGLLLTVLEYVDGPSLDSYAEVHGPLPLPEIAAIFAQIGTALDAAHQAGIIHRDLKPSNVLVEGVRGAGDGAEGPRSFLRNLRVRVVDFGLAKIVVGDGDGAALTEHDMVFGTPDYMAPEQVAGEELDQRCDVYAAGVMLYELVVGRVPFETPGALDTMAAHLNQPVPEPSSAALHREITPSLEAVILKALAKDRRERYPRALDLSAALAQAVEAAGDEALETHDTDLEHARTAIGTTLRSQKAEAAAAAAARGARVRVVVKETPPSSDSAGRRSVEPISDIGPGDGERRLWLVLALIAAAMAVAAGTWFGLHG